MYIFSGFHPACSINLRKASSSGVDIHRTIKRYSTFAEFHGMEDTIGRIVNYFWFAAQGLRSASKSSTCWGPSAAASRPSPNG